MITTDREDLMVTFRSLRDHGASKSDLDRHIDLGGSLLPEFNQLGYNYRLTDLQAALGVAQMRRAAEIIAARIARAERYNQILKKEEWFKTPETPGGYIHSYQSYVGLLQPRNDAWKAREINFHQVLRLNEKRNQIMEQLGAKGIAVRQGTHAVHMLGYFQKKYRLKPEDYINSFIAERLSITLPLYVQMTDEEQDYVIQELKACVESLVY